MESLLYWNVVQIKQVSLKYTLRIECKICVIKYKIRIGRIGCKSDIIWI